ncbi:cyclodeaminase/cyclohydrolase family protein [Halomonas sp. HP20-15]|uniref:cyclodeaminase/cyclohydrolase family protein n=1 Tax=Halomonas sp. HP20-15 TaxID=3085901 RepID=UPI002981F334|nr:cyclodeaminase/cyclohydrolase family protein [Halomonas sp. HP20-15]MDW5377683.1 cyclodeaminase/cyclohydrolase family protein [Halomonas sp. HP20-15]
MSQSTSIWAMTLGDFRDAVESRSTPGCGAAAAASAGMGLALVLKGLRITDGKHPDVERGELIARGDARLAELGRYADEDVEAFDAYLAAVKRPQDSDVERRARERAIQAAAERANRVPLATARSCLEALRLSVEALTRTADNLRSDTLAGGLMLHAALSSVLINVDANLASLHDAAERESMAAERHALQRDADRHLQRLRSA